MTPPGVTKVNVVVELHNDFEGVRSVAFTFVPGPDDAPLVDALLAKNDAILLAAARAAGAGDLLA
jgi:hypothetical protein